MTSLSPILQGRIPGSLVSSRLNRHIQADQRLLMHLQEQIATGQKFFLPSESPSAALRTIHLQKLMERKTQALANVELSTSLLSASEAALGTVSDALNQARGLITSGLGASTTEAEKKALAIEAGALIQQVMNAANSHFRGRYLFGGSMNNSPPFVQRSDGSIVYQGDRGSVQSLIDLNSLLSNSVDGDTALGGFTTPITSDINPALTLQTRISDLSGGRGVELGPVVVTLENGGPTQTQTIDLTGAQTLNDIKVRLENAFSGGPLTLTVDIDPASQNGLRLTPSAGTVAVADVEGSLAAADLGIRSNATAVINGADLNPRITLETPLSTLNGGAGISAAPGTGFVITNGNRSATIDVSAATTVGDLFNLIRQANLDVDVQINAAGNGLAITSRASGAAFSIGENGGTTARDLGIRTFSANTELADLNYGTGVPVNDGQPLKITRRDGTTLEIDLSSTNTIQDVLDRINAVDPGNLVASVTSVGNGIQLTDNSGTGPLVIDSNAVGQALGLAGSETGADPLVPLTGSDPNPQEVDGVMTLLVRLQRALHDGDDRELTRLSGIVETSIENVNLVRGEIGGRLKILDETQNRLKDETLRLEESLSETFYVDVAEVITQLANRQFTLEATMKIAAQTMNLSLMNYL